MVKRVMAYGLVAVMACVSSTLLTTTGAQAFSKAVMENGKTCRSLGRKPHHHKGHGRYFSSKKDAEAAAIARWVRFTTWEYGAAWGDFGYAEHKSFDCMLGATGKNWKCAVKAQPCMH